jgi:uncharacterized membrane protein YccC
MLERALRFSRQSAFASGIRCTAGPVIPLLIGVMTGQPGLWLNVAIGGLLVSTTDMGGANRRKAVVMAAATLAGAIACVLGTLSGATLWLAVLLMFVVAFVGGMTNAFGSRAAVVGMTFTMAFVFRLSPPSTPVAALERSVGFIIGGLWAMALSLWLWPTRPFQTAAEAIESFYRQLSTFIASAGARGDETPAGPDHVRVAVEAAHIKARDAVVAVRSSLDGQSAIGQRLILLSSNGENLLQSVATLREEMAIASTRPRYDALQPALHDFLNALADATLQIANAVAARGGNVDASAVRAAAQRVDAEVTSLMRASPDLKSELRGLIDLRNLSRGCAFAAGSIQAAIDAVRMRSEDEAGFRRIADGSEMASQERALELHAVLGKIRDNLTFRSLPFRHALRLAVTASLGVAIYKFTGIDHGYWLPLAIVIIMKPDFGGTRQRAAQAALGTVIGGAIATVLALLITNDYVQIALMIPLGLVAFASLPRSYVVYTVLFTPFFILMIDIVAPGSWQLGIERIVFMLGGAILSFLAVNLLWPSWERERLPQQLGKTIGANRAYLNAVLGAYLNPSSDRAAVRTAREQANVENVNAEASFQRLIAEPKARQGNLASAYALVTYNQRFYDGVTTLASYLREFSGKSSLPGLPDVAGDIDQVMSRLAESVQTGRPVESMPALDQDVRALDVSMQQMFGARADELANRQDDSPNRQAIYDFSPVQAEMTRLAQDVAAMARIEAQMA